MNSRSDTLIPLDGPVIEVRQLRKTYAGGVEAVKGIDFDVASGEAFGLLGPNGAGKSTTIGMLTTTILPTGGTARLAGFDVAIAPLSARRVSSVVFQDPVVDRGLSGRSNLEIHARLWGVDARSARTRITDVVDAVGLSDLLDRKVESYSGGQRRRLEIARALVSEPRVLFLDEPTVGLDPRIRFELLDVIAQLRDRADTTILLTTHYLVALLASLGREIVELRIDGPVGAAAAALRSRGIAGEDAFTVGSTLTVPLHNHSTAEAISTIHDLHLPVAALSTRQPTLDDVYLRLTGDRIADAA